MEGLLSTGPTPSSIKTFIQATQDMQHLTCDMRHMTQDMCHTRGGEHSLKIFRVCLNFHENKPAAQAAGADLSRLSSTIRQNPPIHQNRRNF